MTKEITPDPSFHERIFLAISSISTIEKNRVNKYNQSTYSDIDALTQAVNPAFFAQRLFVSNRIEHATLNNTNVLRLEVVVISAEGEEKSFGWGEWMAHDGTPQGVGSTKTYARRYGLQAAFNLSSPDDDGELIRKATMEWATDEQSEALEEVLVSAFESKEAAADTVKAFHNYLRQAGWMEDGRVVKDHYQKALKAAQNKAKQIKDEAKKN
jgi:hypothetical protein